MDWKISVVSSNFIALLLILTISLTVHVLVKVNELKKENNNFKEALSESIDQMFLPCFFAALTTAIAFLSLLLGDLKPVIEFGKMMAFGINHCIYLHIYFVTKLAINHWRYLYKR